MYPVWISIVLLALVLGFVVGLWLQSKRSKEATTAKRAKLIEEAKSEATAIREAAEVEAKELKLQQKEEAEAALRSRESEVKERQRELSRKLGEMKGQQEKLGKRERDLERKERSLGKKEEAAEAAVRRAERSLGEAREQLERMAGLSQDQALDILKAEVIDDARAAAAEEVARIEAEVEQEADRKAKLILANTIQRFASEYVAERTVSVVQLASDDLKGRIIGREGRNIRALEAATGVDLIVDDTPEAVILSCFNPVRREVARVALTRLVADGRIHPTRIEEVVKKAQREIDNQCKEAGEQAIFDLGLHKIHPELVRLLGTLKFRSSYAQNLLRHSVEVGFLSGMLASELKVNAKMARRAGLLHDIGKAVDHQSEGSHAEVGAALARKYSEPPKVVSAIAAHHGDPPPRTVLDYVVAVANELSASRPGARLENLESYVKRLYDLEKIAASFEGIRRAYAIQAGREVRILVDTERVSDQQSSALAKQIARKVEDELTYPGQIRVNVIRESRATEVAR